MARLFAAVSIEYLEAASAVVLATPLTMACWTKLTTTAAYRAIMGISNGGAEYFGLHHYGTWDGQVIARTRSEVSDQQARSTAFITDTDWHHTCAVFSAVDARAAYLDGGDKGVNSDSSTPAGIDRTQIGTCGGEDEIDGIVAYPAIWNCALTDAEVLSLALGKFPWQVRPESLVAYWPLGDDIRDHVGQYHMTAYNSPIWTPHPPQMPNTKRRLWHRGLPATNLFKGHEVFR